MTLQHWKAVINGKLPLDTVFTENVSSKKMNVAARGSRNRLTRGCGCGRVMGTLLLGRARPQGGVSTAARGRGAEVTSSSRLSSVFQHLQCRASSTVPEGQVSPHPLKSVRAWRRAHDQVKKARRVGFAFPRLRTAESAMPLIVTEAEDSNLSPTWATLRLVALQRAVPFIGFGFMDNAIMILAGDYIEQSIGFTLGISTMAAAALGVLIADVLGLGVGGMIEELSVRMGVPEPRLTRSQTEMWVTRLTAMAGSSFGIALGCLLGMLPLAFLDLKKGDREEAPVDVYGVLAKEAADMLQAQRVLIITVEYGTRNMAAHYSSDNADKALAPLFLREVVLRTLKKDEAVLYTAPPTHNGTPPPGGIYSALSVPVLDREGKLLAVTVAINKHDLPPPSTPDNKPSDIHNHTSPPRAQGQGQGQNSVSRRTTTCVPSPAAAAALFEGRRFDIGSDLPCLCVLAAKAGEAMDNLYRRAEEHNSFAQNMDALQMHLSVPVVCLSGLESTQRRTTVTRAGGLQGPQRWVSSNSTLD